MTLETRARRAAQGIHRAVEVMEMSRSTKEPRKVERFDRFRDRKQRNRRIGAILAAAALTIAGIAVVATGVLDRGQGTIPGDQDVSPPPATLVEPTQLGTLTRSEGGCTLDVGGDPDIAHIVGLTVVNETDRPASFDLVKFESSGLTYEEFEAQVQRERLRAEAGKPLLGSPAGAEVVLQQKVGPGGSETIAEGIPAGRYAIVCLHPFDEGVGMRPFASVGPVVFE